MLPLHFWGALCAVTLMNSSRRSSSPECGSRVDRWALRVSSVFAPDSVSRLVSLSVGEFNTGPPASPPTRFRLFSDFHWRQGGRVLDLMQGDQGALVKKQCQEGGRRRMDDTSPGPLAFNQRPGFEIFLRGSCRLVLPLSTEYGRC